MKRERTQITSDLKRSHVLLKRIIKEYYEQLCAHEFDNLCEMDQFLERYNLPKLTGKK